MILSLFVTHNNKKGNWMPWGSDMMYTRTHTRWDEKHRFDLFRASHFNKKWRTIERKNINDMKRTHTHTHLACLSNHEWRVVTDNVFSMYLPILLLCLFNSISYLPYYFYIFLCIHIVPPCHSSHHFMYYFSWNVPHIYLHSHSRTAKCKMTKENSFLSFSFMLHSNPQTEKFCTQFYQSREKEQDIITL